MNGKAEDLKASIKESINKADGDTIVSAAKDATKALTAAANHDDAMDAGAKADAAINKEIASTAKTPKKEVVSDSTKLRRVRAELGQVKKALLAAEESLRISESKNVVLFNESQDIKAANIKLKEHASLVVSTFINATNSTLATTTALYKTFMG